MLHKKKKTEPRDATEASVRREMARPRVAKSARKQPSTTIPGAVEKILPSPRPSLREKAQVVVDAPDPDYRTLRIENTLTNKQGASVELKKGARVLVTVTAGPKHPRM